MKRVKSRPRKSWHRCGYFPKIFMASGTIQYVHNRHECIKLFVDDALGLVAVKPCSGINPVPSVLSLNTVPFPALPPPSAVPYRVLPDKINPAIGKAPS